MALPGKERAPQAQAVTGGLTGPDSESPDLSGRGQAQGRAQLLWGGSLRGVAAPARRRAPDLAPGPSTGDLLDEPQCVLPNVDQASQSLHWLLGRGGGVGKLAETKQEKAVCLQRPVPVPRQHRTSRVTKNSLARRGGQAPVSRLREDDDV